MSTRRENRPPGNGEGQENRPPGDGEGVHAESRTHYVRAFVALLLLTTLTLGLTFLEMGALGPVSAIGIALAKATLVALFFMHLVEHRTSSWLTLVVAMLLAGTLVTLAVLDVATRAG